ncbi:flippase [Paenibacillus tarimensis]|uniref:flippase n=1 Tax=Paenibacillus tarimensis TaxID=416012 RepID=UPI001F419809|nr:flippase [Paenibacillus tarimensis]MCF2944231.1 flippase [Paenibacillus tarimensis]
MNKKSTGFQIITTLGTRFAVLFGAFFVSVLTARLLGPEGKGIITALLVIPTLVVTIADLGIRQSTAYFIGKQTFELKAVTSSLNFIWLMSSILCTLIVGLLYWLQYGDRYSWWLMGIMLLTIPVNLGIQYLRGVMQGKLKIGSINFTELLKTGLNFGILLLLVGLWKWGVMGAAVTQLLMAVFTLLYSIRALKEIPFGIHYNGPIIRSMITRGFSFALALFVLQLNYRFDVLILEAYTNVTEVGIYSVGTNIAEVIWQVPAAIGLILFSKGANASREQDSIDRTTRLIRLLVPVLIVCGALFWIFAPVIITALYGQAFAASATVIRYIMPGILSFVIVKLLHSEISGRGYPLFSLNVSIVSLLINVGMNLLLIPKYGAIGASISSATSYTFAGLLFLILYTRREKLKLRHILVMTKADAADLKQRVSGIWSRRRQKGKQREVGGSSSA